MDPLSQGVLGAAAAASVAPHERTRSALVLGGLAAMSPDLDVFIRSSTDPLLFLEFHRQFTHALAFIPIGALLCALLALPFVRRRQTFRFTYAMCFVGYATHGLLDACTSYGTQLYWPLSDQRVAWNVVSVVDPAFTAPLIVLVVLAAVRRRPALAQVGIAWALVYLTLGWVQRERAHTVATQLAAKRYHPRAVITAKPSFGNLLLWKTFYENDGIFYVDGVRLGMVPRVFPGESVRALDRAADLRWLEATDQQARDLDRFARFSRGFIALDAIRPHRVIDVRYSMVPNRIAPLWGIDLDPEAPADAHAAFFAERGLSDEERSQLIRMLTGNQ